VAEVRLRVLDPTGLHARPAARFVQAASRFQGRVAIVAEGRTADAKSLLAILGLAVRPGCEIVLTAEGEDDARAVEELARQLSPYVEPA
jgi:phosphocarrier protein HPr